MKDFKEIRTFLIKRYPSLGLLKIFAKETLGDLAYQLPDGEPSLLEYADSLVNLAEATNNIDNIISSLELRDKNYVDVVILCPLLLELRAVLNKIKVIDTINKSGLIYYLGEFIEKNGKTIKVVATCLSEYGNLSSFDVSSKLLDNFTPKSFFISGIAGGIQNKKGTINKGDIIIPKHILYYEIAKERSLYQFANRVFITSPSFIQRVLAIEATDEFEKSFISNINLSPPVKVDRIPKRHIGVGVASGEKVLDLKDSLIRKHIEKQDLSIVGIEMESAGVATMFSYKLSSIEKLPEFGVIRSISDMADGTKDKIWQDYCADVAATYLFELLKFGILST